MTDDIIAAETDPLFITNAIGPRSIGTAFAAFDISDTSGNTLWLLTMGGVFKTTNFVDSGSVKWTNMNLPVIDGIPQSDGGQAESYRMDRTNRLMVDPLNPNVVYVGTAGHGLWRTTNGGTKWEQLSNSKVPFFNYKVVH